MPKGFSTLLAVIIFSAVSLTTVLSLSIAVLSYSRISASFSASFKAKALAEACLEQALMEIRRDTNHLGTTIFSLDGNPCTYTVIDIGGNTREVRSEASFSGVTKKIIANINQLYPKITLSSWDEVADF